MNKTLVIHITITSKQNQYLVMLVKHTETIGTYPKRLPSNWMNREQEQKDQLKENLDGASQQRAQESSLRSKPPAVNFWALASGETHRSTSVFSHLQTCSTASALAVLLSVFPKGRLSVKLRSKINQRAINA